MPLSEETILGLLRQVRDPELMINIVDLGLVYGIGVDEIEGKTNIHVIDDDDHARLPFGPELLAEVKKTLESLEGASGRSATHALAPLDARPHDQGSPGRIGDVLVVEQASCLLIS